MYVTLSGIWTDTIAAHDANALLGMDLVPVGMTTFVAQVNVAASHLVKNVVLNSIATKIILLVSKPRFIMANSSESEKSFHFYA